VPEIRYDVASRFLYFSSVTSSIWVIYSAIWLTDEVRALLGARWARAVATVFVLLCVLYTGRNVSKLVFFESEWQIAGDISAGIIRDITEAHPDPRPGEVWCFESVPDNYHDKYVFRNGIEAALYLAYGRRDFEVKRLDLDASPPRSDCDCVFSSQELEVSSKCDS
jgi:hypothetical protein